VIPTTAIATYFSEARSACQTSVTFVHRAKLLDGIRCHLWGQTTHSVRWGPWTLQEKRRFGG